MEAPELNQPISGAAKHVFSTWPYWVIFLILVLGWNGFLLRGKAPYMTIVPGGFSVCKDISLVYYASYLSGHHALEGFSVWSFAEGLGNNFYLNVLARYFNPFNVLGAFLVDHHKAGIFQFFGYMNFILFVIFLWGCVYYFKNIIGYSNSWAFFAAYLCVFFCNIYPNYSNYFGIFMFFPFCLIAIDFFCKRTSPKSCIIFLMLLSLPLHFGMVNIYINYVMIALIVTVAYIIGVKNVNKRNRLIVLSLIVFTGAIIGNSVIWGPMAIEMLKSTGQIYTRYRNLYVLNPFVLPAVIIWRLLFTRAFPELLLNASANSTWFYFLFQYSRLNLFLFVVGLFFSFRKRIFIPGMAWYFSFVGVGIFYYFCQIFNNFGHDRLIYSLNLLKIPKYQSLMVTPFLVLFTVEGCRALLNTVPSSRFRKLAIGYLFVLFAVVVMMLAGYIAIPFFFPGNLKLLSHDISLMSLKEIFTMPSYRWQIFSGPYYYFIKIASLIGSGMACAAFLWVIITRTNRRLVKAICLAITLFAFCFFPYFTFGGFHVSKETYAEDYFKPQGNEVLLRHLLEKDSFQYRAVYNDPENNNLKADPVPPELKHQLSEDNRSFWFGLLSRKYMSRYEALGISVADGWQVFPSLERREFYKASHITALNASDMEGLAWDINDPLNPLIGSKCNVKYVLSPYPLPDLKLINKSDDYWGYLYEANGSLPICRVVSRQDESANMPGAQIKLFRSLPDRIQVHAFTEHEALLRINITADSYWTAVVNGKKAPLKILDGVFMGIDIPQGRSDVELAYKYWPLPVFASLSFIGMILSFLMICYYMRRWPYEVDHPNTLL